MRKISIFYLIITIPLFFSCGEMREEITINKDGSGKYEISSDMIPMMRTMMQSMAKLSVEEGEEPDSAAMALKVEEMIWKDFPAEIDSVITLDNELPPEVKNDPKAMALLENTVIYMRGGRDAGYIKSGFEFTFDNTNQFEDFTNLLEETGKKNRKASAFSSSKTKMKIEPNYFLRTATSINKKNADAQTKQMMPMVKDMNILTVLNFQRKIDQIELVHYEVVERTETSVTLRYDFMEAYESGKESKIEIKLK